jgi:hypothetical protein
MRGGRLIIWGGDRSVYTKSGKGNRWNMGWMLLMLKGRAVYGM